MYQASALKFWGGVSGYFPACEYGSEGGVRPYDITFHHPYGLGIGQSHCKESLANTQSLVLFLLRCSPQCGVAEGSCVDTRGAAREGEIPGFSDLLGHAQGTNV